MGRNKRIGGAAGSSGGLRYTDWASHTANTKGNFSFHKVVYYDDFTGVAIDNTYDYTVAGVAEGGATVAVPHVCDLATATNDDDDTEMAMGVAYYGQYNATMEVRFRILDVDETCVNLGFANATGYSADALGMMYSGTTLASEATEFAGLMYDTEASTDYLYFISSKAGSDGSVISTAVTPTDTSYHTMRVELVDNGTTTDARFYLNSTGLAIDPYADYVGIELDAVTRTTAMCPYFGIINHDESAANHLYIDYIKVWQDRY